jgi:hypothetical protein
MNPLQSNQQRMLDAQIASIPGNVRAAIVAAGRVTMRDPTDPLPASPIPLPSR